MRLQVQLGGDPPLEQAVRAAQAGERSLARLVVAEHADEHARAAQVRARPHVGHGHESDARVRELSGERVGEDLADRLVDAAHALAAGRHRAGRCVRRARARPCASRRPRARRRP